MYDIAVETEGLLVLVGAGMAMKGAEASNVSVCYLQLQMVVDAYLGAFIPNS